jgi:predicted pyridoxine 5'-phosphate oxidase superfamily flavin-nucleotide-binding protein
MASLPQKVAEEWERRNGPVIFSTVNSSGTPNAIYATCVRLFNDELIIVADNYFEKTRSNILAGSKGSLLFITENKKSYQIKGSVEYHKSGEIFENMKSWNPTKHPGHAAAALRVEEVYSGAEKLL